MKFAGEVKGVEKGGIAGMGRSLELIEEALAGQRKLFCFGILDYRLKLIIGKAGENGNVEGLLPFLIGEGDHSLLQREAAESFVEIEVVKGRKTGQREVSLGEAFFEKVFVLETEEQLLIGEERIGAQVLGVCRRAGGGTCAGLELDGKCRLLFFESKISEGSDQADVQCAADDEGLGQKFCAPDPVIFLKHVFGFVITKPILIFCRVL